MLGLPRRKVLESGDAAAAEVRKVALSSAGHAGAAAIGARVRQRRGPGAGLKTTELERGYGLAGSSGGPPRLQRRRGFQEISVARPRVHCCDAEVRRRVL